MGPEVDDDVSADSDDEEGEGGVERVKTEKKNSVRTKYDRMFERKNQDVLAEHYAKMVKTDGDAGGEDVDMSRLDGEQAVDDDL
ncbi:ATP-dependent RNA helicase dbp4, partial [Friedmanniomyces endolithicus]